VGFRQTVLAYDHHPRLSNRAVPVLSRQIRTVLEALFSFSKVPLKTITVVGLVISALAMLSLLGLVGVNLTASNAVTILLAGVQLVCLSVVGEYVSRIYSEVRGRPLYVVRQRIGFQPLPRAARNIVQFLPSEAAARQETATRQRLQPGCPSGLTG
jgi:dolichol-phosphate mannosyltransferase